MCLFALLSFFGSVGPHGTAHRCTENAVMACHMARDAPDRGSLDAALGAGGPGERGAQDNADHSRLHCAPLALIRLEVWSPAVDASVVCDLALL